MSNNKEVKIPKEKSVYIKLPKCGHFKIIKIDDRISMEEKRDATVYLLTKNLLDLKLDVENILIMINRLEKIHRTELKDKMDS